MTNILLPHNETVAAHNAKVNAAVAFSKTKKAWESDPASTAQIGYIKKLVEQRQVDGHTAARYMARTFNGMTKGEAAEAITFLKQAPWKTTEQAWGVVESDVVIPKGEPGVYVGGSGKVYSAAKKQGYTFLTFRRVSLSYSKPKLVKVYSKSAITDINTGGHKMTLEEADAWGKAHQYNGMSFCVCCGKLLTAKQSVELGIGPVCRANGIWA